jgi:nicotinamidase-related amidase
MTGNNTALMVIDVQRELFSKGNAIYKAGDLLQNINTLVERAHAAGAMVVYVQHASKAFLLEESDGWQLHPDLTPTNADLMIRKTHPSSFEDTVLGEELARRGVKSLVVCGLVTHGCVKATTLAALDLGYATTLAGDAHSSYSKDAAKLVDQWNQALASAGARVIATQDVTFA